MSLGFGRVVPRRKGSILQGCQITNGWTNGHFVNISGHMANGEAAEANCQGIIPVDGVFKNLTVKLENAPAGADTVTVTLHINGAPTALTVAITGAATTGSDTTHTVIVAPGDTVTYLLNRTATAADTGLFYGVQFIPS